MEAAGGRGERLDGLVAAVLAVGESDKYSPLAGELGRAACCGDVRLVFAVSYVELVRQNGPFGRSK